MALPPAIADMAGSLGGMFSGQPPGPPPPPPGHPGQASLLQAAPGAPRPSNSTLVDELESSFEVSRAVGVLVQPSEVARATACLCGPCVPWMPGVGEPKPPAEAGCRPCPSGGLRCPCTRGLSGKKKTLRVSGLFGFQPAFSSVGPVGAGLPWSVSFRLSSSEFSF